MSVKPDADGKTNAPRTERDPSRSDVSKGDRRSTGLDSQGNSKPSGSAPKRVKIRAKTGGPRRDPETGQMATFHGRRVGKALRPLQAAAHARLIGSYLLSLDDLADPFALFPRKVERLCLEIGFGGGEHLISEARRAPDTGFIGVEPFLNGMTRALTDLEASGLDNVRVFDDDAAVLLARLPAGCLSRVDLLYPDPWPKRRHWKRRFVRAENLSLIDRALKPGGLFRFASDVPHYVDWTLREVRAHGALAWTAERADDWRLPYQGWPGTRYEAKALQAGRKGTYLTFEKPAALHRL